jgi:hypothetical protein
MSPGSRKHEMLLRDVRLIEVGLRRLSRIFRYTIWVCTATVLYPEAKRWESVVECVQDPGRRAVTGQHQLEARDRTARDPLLRLPPGYRLAARCTFCRDVAWSFPPLIRLSPALEGLFPEHKTSFSVFFITHFQWQFVVMCFLKHRAKITPYRLPRNLQWVQWYSRTQLWLAVSRQELHDSLLSATRFSRYESSIAL